MIGLKERNAKRDKQEAGITLIEIIFVLAIIAILVAIFVPLAIEKLGDADLARADNDVLAIASALTTFFSDIRHFPTCADTCNAASNFSTSNTKFLAFGTGSGALSADYPTDDASGSDWILTDNDEGTGIKNNAYNHLGQNDPNASGGTTSTDYKTTGANRWRGPYMTRFKYDPWNKTFIAHVGKMEKSASGVKTTTTGKGWILSAGPDNALNTEPDSAALEGDDRGFIFTTDSGS